VQTIEVSRGAVLALGFIVGRILYRQKHEITSSTSSEAAVAENATVDRMDVDTSTTTTRWDSSLDTAISSAVRRLGELSSQNCLTSP